MNVLLLLQEFINHEEQIQMKIGTLHLNLKVYLCIKAYLIMITEEEIINFDIAIYDMDRIIIILHVLNMEMKIK